MNEHYDNFDAWLGDQDAWVQGLAQSNGINEAMRRAYYAGKARYVELVAMLRDDELAHGAGMLRREHTSVQEARYAAIDDYRERLLAKIDERRDAQ